RSCEQPAFVLEVPGRAPTQADSSTGPAGGQPGVGDEDQYVVVLVLSWVDDKVRCELVPPVEVAGAHGRPPYTCMEGNFTLGARAARNRCAPALGDHAILLAPRPTAPPPGSRRTVVSGDPRR